MRRFLFFFIALSLLVGAAWLSHSQGIWDKRNPVSFNEDVRPILNESCLDCHGGVRQSGEFSLLFASDAFEPTESGKPAIVPGHPDSSEFVRRIRHTEPSERMPLDHDPLPEDEIRILEQWIAEGAEWDTHWAYKAMMPVEVPVPRNASWGNNTIDAFILKGIEEEGLTVSPEADCRTLIRRVSLDLTGLPPTLDEVEAYCESQSEEAYEGVVDRLLASPRFGEHWAAMWLDLARYADTKGYEKDSPRTIWMYRDWVIKAFNQDMPFDQFTIEQLAGDLLPDPSEDQLIATAFHRNTMNNDEGGTDNEEFRIAAVIDRVNTTWEVWMGTTMACVQCHSHPYDPFRQTEYFEFLAFFNNTADHDTPNEFPILEVAFDSVYAAAHKIKDGLVRTPIMQELPADSGRTTYFFNRGSWLDQGAEVAPGTPGIMNAWPDGAPMNRLGVAQWILDPENPLTSRVTVNRFWAELFGAGLVETMEDFGSQGQQPTHPALLDWLAQEFMSTHEWRVKSLLKDIVMSATYRQRSDVRPQDLELDPLNRYLARAPRIRLSAEQLRDQALAASGLLSDKMYGPGVMPYQPDGIWRAPYSNLAWETSEGEDRYRRGIYTFWRRSAPYPSMVAFDSPSREVCVSRRVDTNTPLQALVTLNDPVYVEAAREMARSMVAAGQNDLSASVRHGFVQALVREPEPKELNILMELYQEAYFEFKEQRGVIATASVSEREIELDAYAVVANAILNFDEFLTKS